MEKTYSGLVWIRNNQLIVETLKVARFHRRRNGECHANGEEKPFMCGLQE
jgi:hypothetical protein